MKKIIELSLIICISIFIIGCEKEVKLIDPIIITNPFDPAPLDTIQNTLIADLEIDGETVDIDSYDWHVYDDNNNEVLIIFQNNEIIKWIPYDEGVYTVEVFVISGNKSVKKIEVINVKHNTMSIHRYLAGDWYGNGEGTFAGGIKWEAEFVIESDGHYSAQVTNVNLGSISSVFDNGIDTLDNPEKKFIINQIDGNGFALGIVRFVHFDGDLLEYNIKDLRFSNQYNKVNFTVFWGAEIHYELNRK